MLRSLSLGLGLETFAKFLRVRFRFRKIWSRKKSLGFGFGKIWSRKKVSVSVLENLVSEEKYRFRFRTNLVSEKSLGFSFGKFGIVKKVSVSVSVKILVSSFSDEKMAHGRCFEIYPFNGTYTGIASSKYSTDAVRKIRAFAQLSKYTCVQLYTHHMYTFGLASRRIVKRCFFPGS